MAYEYAIEPEALLDRQDRRYLVDNLGIGSGRLVAQYPDNWIERVKNACVECQPVEQLNVTRDLEVLRRRLVKTSRLYRQEHAWLKNAINAHASDPFRAIVALGGGESHEGVLAASELRSDTPGWAIPNDGKALRNAADLGGVAGPLLRLSNVILFIDQHYNSNGAYGRPLAEFLKHAQTGKKPHKIEYHLKSDSTADFFASGLDKQRRFLDLHDAVSVVFVRWKKMDEGENQHARYILTNRGGLRFDYGLDEGPGTTDWNRLSEELWEERKSQFNPTMGVYELVDAYKVSSEDVVRVTPYNGGWR